jgi:hypothetical protein
VDAFLTQVSHLRNEENFEEMEKYSFQLMLAAIVEALRLFMVLKGGVQIFTEYIAHKPCGDIPKKFALSTLRNLLDSQEAHDILIADHRFRTFIVGLQQLLKHAEDKVRVVAVQTMEKLALKAKSLEACRNAGLFDKETVSRLQEMMKSTEHDDQDKMKAKKAATSTMAACAPYAAAAAQAEQTNRQTAESAAGAGA